MRSAADRPSTARPPGSCRRAGRAAAASARLTASTKVLDALVAAHERGATLMSICVGAFVLGQAGRLDHRPVTTHWAFADHLARRFPRARLQPGKLYVDDGDPGHPAPAYER
jgi:transcriptional regulator GlxA family with amidase domain